MCGICGLLVSGGARPEHTEAVRRMTALIARRGPDDEGFWVDNHALFGFRRLSILDLSPAGHQPMISADGNSVIMFNGELYNYLDLRRELEALGVQFRSRSDTEVALEALNYWGIRALERFNGMFAVAWYRRPERQLVLARDHAGIKPLYYSTTPEGIAFGSQYNCLMHTPWGLPGPLRTDVLHLYLRLHYVPAPYGILENTYQVEPGQYVLVCADGSIRRCTWWALPHDPESDLRGGAALEALGAALDDAVRRQRIADVPLGVFLSGGVDSPLVAAIARKQTDRSLKAFTISSPGWWQDETADAKAYAQRLDVDHHIHTVSEPKLADLVAEAAAAQPEPFGDFSILPTLLVSRAARAEMTVALSGDGGDELFWGYERPISLMRNGGDFRWPWAIRAALYAAGKLGIGPRRSDVIIARTPGQYYFEVNSRLKGSTIRMIAPGIGPLPAEFQLYDFERFRGMRNLANYSRYVEFYGQLQRGLKKVDMGSMHHGLEVRVPLLDRAVIETSLRLDPLDAMRDGTRKAVLRNLLARYVPAEMIPRPKRGFAVPLGDWLRGPLRSLVEDVLLGGDPTGIFDQAALRAYCEAHFEGKTDHKWGIWTLLMLQEWATTHLKTAHAG